MEMLYHPCETKMNVEQEYKKRRRSKCSVVAATSQWLTRGRQGLWSVARWRDSVFFNKTVSLPGPLLNLG